MLIDPELIERLRQSPLAEAVENLEHKAVYRGVLLGRANAIPHVLRARKIRYSSWQYDKIMYCTDMETLGRWLDAAAVGTNASEILR